MFSQKIMNEFSMIEEYFLPLTMGHKESLLLKDDAAIFDIPKNHELIVTSDTLSAGVHFLKNEQPEYIAHKALRVNLSDLAAMGAVPLAYQLCIAFPKKPYEQWIKKFTAALLKDQKEFGIFCSGGDTTITKGALTISITAMGLVPKGKAMKRSGAKVGDVLIITGPVGGAAAGLKMLKGELPLPEGGGRGRGYGSRMMPKTLPPHPALPLWGREIVNAYQKPVPRLAAASSIRRYANAAIDISDGLIADVAHVCMASGCTAKIDIAAMQFHQVVQKYLTPEEAITGGDDYELALAASPKNLSVLLKNLRTQGLKPQIIGEFIKGEPKVLIYKNGKALDFKKSGWTHF